MSALIMGLVWELPKTEKFRRPEKFVLLAYADHADQNGNNIFPSVKLIAKKTCYEERIVQIITRNLEAQGFLLPFGMGPHGTNRWVIPIVRTKGGAKIAPVPMLKNAPEGNAPEGNAPEPSLEVNTYDDEGAMQNVFAIYESNIGPLTPMISDGLRDAEIDYGSVWVGEAIQTAVLAGARSLKYIQAVLKNRKENGNFKPQKTRGTSRRSQQPVDADAIIDQVLGV